jgi:hypothetical protein
MLDIAAATAINALVIDIKDESGRVFHITDTPTAAAVGAGAPKFDLADRVAEAHEAGLYVIVRIVSFQDPIAARARPEWAVWDTSTNAPYTNRGQWFLDPTDPAPRGYALELAEDACAQGVDEVQFDYVRFPDGSKDTMRFDGGGDAATRQAVITAFLAEARDLLAPMGCATAADIFGFIVSITHEGGIGQQLEALAEVTDVLSPMVYPSHYSTGWFGFAVPNDHPREVVANALADGLARLSGFRAILRPWIQDFGYTAAQVRAEIDSATEAGTGFMLWNALSEFTVAGIPVELPAPAPPPVEFADLSPSGFYDVADGNVFTEPIAWMADQAITRGCNPPWNDFYCPDDPVTRAQMAAFLSRALGLPEAPPGDRFVDDGGLFEADIERLAGAGITLGCNPPDNDRFCPGDPLTRAQMAAFLFRALAGEDDGGLFPLGDG